MKNKFKVLITTSGLGQRLGDLTKYTNKSLIRIGKKPAISYILEAYPKDTEFIVTIGHFGNQVKDFIKIAYPDIKVIFVEVDKYHGPGSSLGYSMLAAKKYLQCPFIFHCNDTIVTEPIPAPDKNWNGGFKGTSSASYSTFTVAKNGVAQINDKGALEYDFIHIGLVGIKDYQSFWYNLESLYLGSLYKDSLDISLNDCKVINVMIGEGASFEVREFKSWLDIGNADGLNQARDEIGETFKNLDKPGEAIFIFEKFVIKFYFDESVARQRVLKAKNLGSVVPEVLDKIGNFYKYKYIEGDVYPRVITLEDFSKFLNWCKKNLWVNKEEVSKNEFKRICKDFYYKKTKDRIAKLFSGNKLKDTEETINGDRVPSIKELLSNIDFDWLSEGQQCQIHGDLVMDNIIKTKDGYKLLDWRQNFGGLLKSGDLYYDLSKLNHNLVINHDIVNRNLFTFSKNGQEVSCDILRSDNLISCQNLLYEFIEKENLDTKKVRILTAIIWLNMSPLHPTPTNFNLFLYYFGKLNLYRALNWGKLNLER